MKTEEYLKNKFGKNYSFIINQLKAILRDGDFNGFMIYGKQGTGKTDFKRWFEAFCTLNQKNTAQLVQEEGLYNCVITTQSKEWFDARPEYVNGFVFTEESPYIQIHELIEELPAFSALLKSQI